MTFRCTNSESYGPKEEGGEDGDFDIVDRHSSRSSRGSTLRVVKAKRNKAGALRGQGKANLNGNVVLTDKR